MSSITVSEIETYPRSVGKDGVIAVGRTMTKNEE